MKATAGALLARDMMVRRVMTIRPEQRVYEAVQSLLKRGFSGAPVTDRSNRLLGILSEKDCIHALIRAVQDQLPPSLVRDVMSTDLITVREDDHLLTVAHYFLTKPIRRVPVVDQAFKLIGQISRRDLLRAAVYVFDEAPTRDAAVLYLSALEEDPPWHRQVGSAMRRRGTPAFQPVRKPSAPRGMKRPKGE